LGLLYTVAFDGKTVRLRGFHALPDSYDPDE
jgi:hypothetical protein